MEIVSCSIDIRTGRRHVGHVNQVYMYTTYRGSLINMLRPEQNGRQFADSILKYIMFNLNSLSGICS